MFFTLQPSIIEMDVSSIANLQYFEFKDAFHSNQDSHNFCELVYVDKGRVEISSDHYVGEMSQGAMIIHTANQRHSLTCNDDTSPNIIIIGFECTAQALDRLTYFPIRLTDELQKKLAEMLMPKMHIRNLRISSKRMSVLQ